MSTINGASLPKERTDSELAEVIHPTHGHARQQSSFTFTLTHPQTL